MRFYLQFSVSVFSLFFASISFADRDPVATAGARISSMSVVCRDPGSSLHFTFRLNFAENTVEMIPSERNNGYSRTEMGIRSITNVYGESVTSSTRCDLIPFDQIRYIHNHEMGSAVIYALGVEEDVRKHAVLVSLQNYSSFPHPPSAEFQVAFGIQVSLNTFYDDDQLARTVLMTGCELTEIVELDSR